MMLLMIIVSLLLLLTNANSNVYIYISYYHYCLFYYYYHYRCHLSFLRNLTLQRGSNRREMHRKRRFKSHGGRLPPPDAQGSGKSLGSPNGVHGY